MMPVDVNWSNAGVWKTLYGEKPKPIKYKFNLGDKVKLSKHKRIFEKDYLTSWTKETFTIAQRLPGDLPVYCLKEADGDFTQGTFYEQELQKVIETPDHLVRVETFLKSSEERSKQRSIGLMERLPKQIRFMAPL